MRTETQSYMLKMILESQILIEVAALKKLREMSCRPNTIACEDMIEVAEARIAEIKKQLDEL